MREANRRLPIKSRVQVLTRISHDPARIPSGPQRITMSLGGFAGARQCPSIIIGDAIVRCGARENPGLKGVGRLFHTSFSRALFGIEDLVGTLQEMCSGLAPLIPHPSSREADGYFLPLIFGFHGAQS
jgi:hypothetical protein